MSKTIQTTKPHVFPHQTHLSESHFRMFRFQALPFLQAAVEGETGDDVVVKQMTKEEKAPSAQLADSQG